MGIVTGDRHPGFDGLGASRRRAWYVVLLLMFAQIFSYIDRFLPSLMLAPIKADLGLSDFQLGLMLGPAFGLFYVFIGVPIGWLADRYSRRALLATGITIWCSMTAAAGFARSYIPLLITRFGVGLGEATVAPCSVSLISDYFDRDRRPRAISLFMAGTFLGAGCAFLLGGPAVHWISQLTPWVIPGFGEMRSWQMAFLIVGLPGFALALLMFTIREPRRTEQVKRELQADGSGHASTRATLAYMRKRWTAFATLFVGSATVVTMGSLVFWNVALFDRTWGWEVREVGIATGVLFLTGGTIGTLLGIRLSNRWIAEGRRDATMRALWIGLLLAVPGFALYPMMPTAPLAIAALLVAFIGQACAAAAGPVSLTYIAPGQVRSQAIAIYYLVIGVFGQLIGPPPVGLMTDLFGDPGKLRYAMTIEAAVVGTAGILLVRLGLHRYRRAAEELVELVDARDAVPAHA
ncbi:MAG: MFS transporter [Steroidobacteraceae bacterium]|nr:MFS transporter [Steroidobacteraceae bacterium]